MHRHGFPDIGRGDVVVLMPVEIAIPARPPRQFRVTVAPNVRRDVDQNVDVAVGAGVAAGARAEQGSMAHTRSLQGGLMLAQLGKDVLLFHGMHSTRSVASRQSKNTVRPSQCLPE